MKNIAIIIVGVGALFLLSACGSMSQPKLTERSYYPVSQVSTAPTAPIPVVSPEKFATKKK